MGIAQTVEQQLKQAREAVEKALSEARSFAREEIVQPLQEAAAKLDAIHNRADGAMDRFIHGIEQSRYTVLIVTGATLGTFASGMALGWAVTVAFS